MSNDRYDNIADYLNGAMPAEERILFEKEILDDAALREEVNIFKTLQAALQDDEQYANNDNALSAAFTQLNKDFFKPDDSMPSVALKKDAATEGRIKGRIRWRGNPVWQTAAAAVLIGMVVVIAIWFMRNEKNNQPPLVHHEDSARIKENTAGTEKDNAIMPDIGALYTKHFSIDKKPSQVPADLSIAFNSMAEKKYRNAIDAFAAAVPNGEVRGEETDSALLFYIDYYSAQCLMSLNEAGKAIVKLQQALKESPDNFSKAKTQWYLALAYLKTGDIEKAKQILNSLSVNDKAKEYETRSGELLKELK
ncbi:MAG TPA: tetratricopeptide repeat protein [Chitinophagaceae bacterium]|nr:tetratricopeptide repeat protein [Chitinophagaceae bacterium]